MKETHTSKSVTTQNYIMPKLILARKKIMAENKPKTLDILAIKKKKNSRLSATKIIFLAINEPN